MLLIYKTGYKFYKTITYICDTKLCHHFLNEMGQIMKKIPYKQEEPNMKRTGFAKSIDPDKAAHCELPHLDLHFLSSGL